MPSKKTIPVKCIHCKADFLKSPTECRRSKRHFCSRSCAAKENNKGVQRNRAKRRVCSECGKAFVKVKGHSSRYWCPECIGSHKTAWEALDARAKDRTIGEERRRAHLRGKHPSWAHAYVRNLNRKWNANLLGPCQHCQYDKHSELCHLRDMAQFPDTTPLGVVNHPDNVVALCRNCHWEQGNGWLRVTKVKGVVSIEKTTPK